MFFGLKCGGSSINNFCFVVAGSLKGVGNDPVAHIDTFDSSRSAGIAHNILGIDETDAEGFGGESSAAGVVLKGNGGGVDILN